VEKRTIGQLLNERTNKDAEPAGVVKPVNLGQAQQTQENAVAPGKPARGEVTMDKFIEDIRYLFDEGAQLGIDKQGVVGHVVKTAQGLLQEEKAQITGATAQTTATSAIVTTQFNGKASEAPAQPASVATPKPSA